MPTQQTNDQLTDALKQLEQRLETPVIPGELPDWCEQARTAADEVEAQLRIAVEQTHPKLFQQILDHDVVLEPRIDEMQEADAALLPAMEKVSTYLKHLTDAGEAVEPHEAKIDEHVKNAVDKGLALVIAIRKQEAAIDTWYVESLERDRGVAD